MADSILEKIPGFSVAALKDIRIPLCYLTLNYLVLWRDGSYGA